MQRNAQYADRPGPLNATEAPAPDRDQAEEVRRLLGLMLELTRTAVSRITEGDTTALREFLLTRGRILERIERISEEAASVPGSALRQKQFKMDLALMMQSIMAENSRVVEMIRERKKVVLGKIASAQNRRNVLRYMQ